MNRAEVLHERTRMWPAPQAGSRHLLQQFTAITQDVLEQGAGSSRRGREII